MTSSWSLFIQFVHVFTKKIQRTNFIKICPVRTELFHADRRTDMTKLKVAFRNFAKAPKNALAPAASRTLERPGYSSVPLLTTIFRLHFVTAFVVVVSCLRTFSPGTLEPKKIPTSQASRIMCDVPSTAIFCSESIERFPGTAPNFPFNICYHSGGSMHYRYNYTFHVSHSFTFCKWTLVFLYFLLPCT